MQKAQLSTTVQEGDATMMIVVLPFGQNKYLNNIRRPCWSFLHGIILVLPLQKKTMEFIPLEHEDQLQEIKQAKGLNIIFKHNTTCPISKGVRSQFEKEADSIEGVQSTYFLDLLAHRNISDAIAEQFNVEHQSPQLLLIKDGVCTYNEALYEISAKATAEAIG